MCTDGMDLVFDAAFVCFSMPYMRPFCRSPPIVRESNAGSVPVEFPMDGMGVYYCYCCCYRKSRVCRLCLPLFLSSPCRVSHCNLDTNTTFLTPIVITSPSRIRLGTRGGSTAVPGAVKPRRKHNLYCLGQSGWGE